MDSLSDLEIEEVFNKEKADEYEKRFALIWDELVSAHSSMFILEKVRDFPLDLLFSPTHDQIFLPLVERNFSHQVGLIVANIFADKNKHSATFDTLVKWIKNNCLSEPSNRDRVLVCLEKISGSAETTSLKERCWKLRNKLLAHLDWRYALDPNKLAEIQITYDELRTLANEAEEVLQKLRVGGGVSILPFAYSPLVQRPVDMDPRTDIEKLLDLLASSDDSILIAPERHSNYWESVTLISVNKEWSKEDKETFNRWRRRIGKDEVSFD